MGDVVVVGSINADVVLTVRRFPAPGVTVVADQVRRSAGGKGANQAFAAARSGARTILIGAVGSDDDGDRQLAALAEAGVDVTGVERHAGQRTGTAYVVVLASGENAIVVDPGANACLDPDRVVQVLARMVAGPPQVVLLQSEVGASVVDASADAAEPRGARVVVNNGPWSTLAPQALGLADPLVLNEHEAAEACVGPVARDPVTLAESVRTAHGCRSVVVTLGARGAALSAPHVATLVPAAPVAAVIDTTGAGDAFVGTLAATLARGHDVRHAVEMGQRAAADVVSTYGARVDGGGPRSPRA